MCRPSFFELSARVGHDKHAHQSIKRLCEREALSTPKQTNPTKTIIIIMATTQQGTGTGMKKLAEKPTLLGEKQQDKLKIHGRTLLEFEVGPATDKTSTLPSA